MSIRTKSAFAVLPAVLLLAGCSETVGPAESVDEAIVTDDVAAFVASTSGDDIDVMTLEGGDIMRPGGQQPGCSRNLFRRFVCNLRAFRGSGNISIERDVEYLDADGQLQDGFDALTTASIHFVTALEGSREHGQITASVQANRDFTVSGLLGEETSRIWNGTGSSARNRTHVTDGIADRVYDFSSESTVENIIIPVPRAGQWPDSGTITRRVTVQIIRGDDVQTRERTVVITFNGTENPIMTVDGVEFDFSLIDRKARRRQRG